MDAGSFIVRQVVGFSPGCMPTPKTLLKMAAYFGGSAMIEPWLEFLRRGSKAVDLTTAAGRTAGAIDLLIAARQLPDEVETRTSWVRQAEILAQNLGHEARSRTAAAGFGQAATEILEEIPLPTAELAPCAYSPAEESTKSKAKSPVAPAARGAA